MFRKLIYLLSGIVLLLVLLCGASYYYFVKRPLPKLEGEIRIKGLHAPVQVLRDSWGVPHIYAEDEHDLFMAQGFVQAQDRLWQMESNRRLASGRLSELIGPPSLELDRLVRTLGVMRAARREVASYNPSDLNRLNAFAAGVNAFIEHRKDSLPLEFRLLNVTPEPWRPEDSIAWAKMMALLGHLLPILLPELILPYLMNSQHPARLAQFHALLHCLSAARVFPVRYHKS